MEKGILYLVATPIGNLGDFSPRAIEILKEVDFIAAEDTRNTLKLLNHFEIKNRLISYYEHNKAAKGPEIVNRISAGESCALVTDAGMPAISDPGEDIVRLCHENGIKVSVIPGPCAFVCALALSGFPGRRFVFDGFLPVEKKERQEFLDDIKTEKRTVILYEAPHKLLKTLEDLYKALGSREIAIIREITKIFEEVKITDLAGAVEFYEANQPKGEFVLVIKGKTQQDENPLNALSVSEHIAFYTDKGFSNMEALKAVASDRSLRKNEIYKLQLEENGKR